MKLLKHPKELFEKMQDLSLSYQERQDAEIAFAQLDKISRAYVKNITGDACVGDVIVFPKKIFGGSFRSPVLRGFRMIEGKIVSDSYGAKKQQHTFTIERLNGEKLRIKGRNLYGSGLWAKKRRACDPDRDIALEEKHERGRKAWEARQRRHSQADAEI